MRARRQLETPVESYWLGADPGWGVPGTEALRHSSRTGRPGSIRA